MIGWTPSFFGVVSVLHASLIIYRGLLLVNIILLDYFKGFAIIIRVTRWLPDSQHFCLHGN